MLTCNSIDKINSVLGTNAIVDVIYARYSSELQREESIDDQIRRCRAYLTKQDIPDANYVVLADKAEVGTSENRSGFQTLKQLLANGRLGTVVCTEQSRLTRGDGAISLIKDIVYDGGRFISVSEGTDTTHKGWEMQVSISGIHHASSNRETADRVRGAQQGRVLDGHGSAGDFCFGYQSVYADAAAALARRARDPKPKKIVVIDKLAADLVREIFRRFAAGESITAITQWLNTSSVAQIYKSGWHHQHVRRLLANQKFIGIWIFGATTTLYNSQGDTKQVPVGQDQMTRSDRPALRIIDQVTWDAVQARLAELKKIYGMREKGKRRGPTKYYKLLYATNLLSGKVLCAKCGSHMIDMSSNGYKRFGCPQHTKGTCPVATRVPRKGAEDAIIALVINVVTGYPDWLAMAMAEMKTRLQKMLHDVPNERAIVTDRLAKVDAEISNLLDLASRVKSASLDERIQRLESEKGDLQTKQRNVQEVEEAHDEMPDENWVREQLRDLGNLLRDDTTSGIRTLRSIVGDITAEEVLCPGKKRGFMRLRFRLHGDEILRPLLGKCLSHPAMALAFPQVGDAMVGEEFMIEMGKPTKMDAWAPQIAKWRAEKVKWTEICERTGLKLANACLALKRFIDGGGAAT